ncbi:MAG: hypothetical protein H0T42_09495 [Deltaproteobacteria bacterium]|nr:hypothetical protein [Deltaproteobacteria bacterium]
MRHATLIALSLVAATGCISDEAEDGENDVGLSDGKADGAMLTDCEKAAIVSYINDGVTAAALQAAGVHSRAAKNLTSIRDGNDRRFGTADDKPYASIEAIDRVAYVGRQAFAQLQAATAERCSMPPADPYAEARDVTKALVRFPTGAVATEYTYPEGGNFDLGGTEFWQRWTGGHSPTFDFSEGTDAGRLCMQAAAIRFETIMMDPPAELVKLDAETNWSGSFFNWNDDYSNPTASGDASGSRLWAWKTHLIKWISQTKKDGGCYLPTRDMVIRIANACLTTARAANGEIEGCQVR